MKKTLYLAVALGIALSFGCSSAEVAAPKFTVETLSKRGTYLSSTDLNGKVLLLDFWATWCGPCLQSMPSLHKLHDTYGPKGLVMVPISNESRNVVEGFAKSQNRPYEDYLDTDNSANALFNIEGYPTLILINKSGKIVYRGHEAKDEELDFAIKEALAE